MGTVDHTKIITAGDLQRFLSVVDPDTPICGYCTDNGVSYYRYYFDGVSLEKCDEEFEQGDDYAMNHYPISGPVITLTGEIKIDKPLEVKK